MVLDRWHATGSFEDTEGMHCQRAKWNKVMEGLARVYEYRYGTKHGPGDACFDEALEYLLEAYDEWQGQFCPFCRGLYPNYKDDCVRQKALAKARGED